MTNAAVSASLSLREERNRSGRIIRCLLPPDPPSPSDPRAAVPPYLARSSLLLFLSLFQSLGPISLSLSTSSARVPRAVTDHNPTANPLLSQTGGFPRSRSGSEPLGHACSAPKVSFVCVRVYGCTRLLLIPYMSMSLPGRSMFNLRRISRQPYLAERISSAPAGAEGVSGWLGLLFRRWVTGMAPISKKDLDVKKLGVQRVMPGNVIEHQQGIRFHLYSYILASHQLKPGMVVMNCDRSKPSKTGSFLPFENVGSNLRYTDNDRDQVGRGSHLVGSSLSSTAFRHGILDPNSQVGNCIPLADIRMGTFVHDIECHPGQGAKLARSAGACAKVVKEPGSQCLLRLPSGVEKLIDSRCRATIGVASNPNHGTHKLRKAGESRWLGRRPIVRGVAMNPVDHPHGGGEGRTKGGRPSVSPWGKPTKAGYKTVVRKRGL